MLSASFRKNSGTDGVGSFEAGILGWLTLSILGVSGGDAAVASAKLASKEPVQSHGQGAAFLPWE